MYWCYIDHQKTVILYIDAISHIQEVYETSIDSTYHHISWYIDPGFYISAPKENKST